MSYDHAWLIGWTPLLSVWHPLRGPLKDWPLAICDASTVDFARDTMLCDIVDRDGCAENTQIFFNHHQRWHYLCDNMDTELLIFKNADSRSKTSDMSSGNIIPLNSTTARRLTIAV